MTKRAIDSEMLRNKTFLTLLLTAESADLNEGLNTSLELALFLVKYSFILLNSPPEAKILKRQLPPHGEIFFQNPNGARYLDPKYSRWLSTDPALGEYVPAAGKGNASDAGNLPGMGGIYNSVNGNLYHYAGNNPIRYVDPDGRDYLTSTIGAVNTFSDIWLNDTSYDKKMAFTSQFTQGFISEYDYAKNSLSSKIRKTLGYGIAGGIGCLNPTAGGVFATGVTLVEKMLASGESEQIIGEKQFDYLRTAEVELKNLNQLISKTTDSEFKEFLLEQSELLESEYYINKLAIYSYYIPTINPQYYGNNKQDLLIRTEFYKNRLKYFETVHSDAIKFFGFDSEGKVLTDKCLDYYSLYKQTRRVME